MKNKRLEFSSLGVGLVLFFAGATLCAGIPTLEFLAAQPTIEPLSQGVLYLFSSDLPLSVLYCVSTVFFIVAGMLLVLNGYWVRVRRSLTVGVVLLLFGAIELSVGLFGYWFHIERSDIFLVGLLLIVAGVCFKDLESDDSPEQEKDFSVNDVPNAGAIFVLHGTLLFSPVDLLGECGFLAWAVIVLLLAVSPIRAIYSALKTPTLFSFGQAVSAASLLSGLALFLLKVSQINSPLFLPLFFLLLTGISWATLAVVGIGHQLQQRERELNLSQETCKMLWEQMGYLVDRHQRTEELVEKHLSLNSAVNTVCLQLDRVVTVVESTLFRKTVDLNREVIVLRNQIQSISTSLESSDNFTTPF